MANTELTPQAITVMLLRYTDSLFPTNSAALILVKNRAVPTAVKLSLRLARKSPAEVVILCLLVLNQEINATRKVTIIKVAKAVTFIFKGYNIGPPNIDKRLLSFE